MRHDSKPADVRGVYEQCFTAQGIRAFYAVTTTGRRIGIIEIEAGPEEDLGWAVLPLWKRLDAVDPVTPASTRPQLALFAGAAQPRASRRRRPRLTLSRGGAG